MNFIFGGSFNPPHNGHVEAVTGLFETDELTGSVSQVVILPSFGTPLKQVGVSFDQRMQMTKIAFNGHKHSDRITISDFEEKEKTEFTWQMLEKLGQKLEPAAFVIGTDQFEKLSQWARYPEVLGMCDWVVLLRKPRKLSQFEKTIRHFVSEGWLTPTSNEVEFKINLGKRERKLTFVQTKAKEISSTEIRTMFARGNPNDAKAIVPEKVFEYIERNHLYGT